MCLLFPSIDKAGEGSSATFSFDVNPHTVRAAFKWPIQTATPGHYHYIESCADVAVSNLIWALYYTSPLLLLSCWMTNGAFRTTSQTDALADFIERSCLCIALQQTVPSTHWICVWQKDLPSLRDIHSSCYHHHHHYGSSLSLMSSLLQLRSHKFAICLPLVLHCLVEWTEIWVWLQCSHGCNLPHLIVANTSRHQWTHTIMYCECFTQNHPIFSSVTMFQTRGKHGRHSSGLSS